MAKGALDIVLTVVTVLGAVGTVAAYAELTKKPDSIAMVENGPGLCATTTIADVHKMQPYAVLLQGLPADAYSGATALLTQDKYSPKNMMCAGDVFIEGPDLKFKDKGVALLRDSVYFCPESRYVRLNYARELIRLNRMEEATHEYDRLCSSFPNWVEPRLEQAAVFALSGQTADADKRVKEVQTIEANNAQAQKLAAVLASDEAVKNKDDAKLKDAFAAFNKGFDADKKLKFPADVKQSVVENDNSVDKAVGALRAQSSANRSDIPVRVDLAKLLIYTGSLDEAKAMLTTAKTDVDKEKDPIYSAEVHRLLAEVLHLTNNDTEALSEFRSAAEFDNQQAT